MKTSSWWVINAQSCTTCWVTVVTIITVRSLCLADLPSNYCCVIFIQCWLTILITSPSIMSSWYRPLIVSSRDAPPRDCVSVTLVAVYRRRDDVMFIYEGENDEWSWYYKIVFHFFYVSSHYHWYFSPNRVFYLLSISIVLAWLISYLTWFRGKLNNGLLSAAVFCECHVPRLYMPFSCLVLYTSVNFALSRFFFSAWHQFWYYSIKNVKAHDAGSILVRVSYHNLWAAVKLSDWYKYTVIHGP